MILAGTAHQRSLRRQKGSESCPLRIGERCLRLTEAGGHRRRGVLAESARHVAALGDGLMEAPPV
jgi:hypothetical protein